MVAETKRTYDTNTAEFVADDTTDLSKLPTMSSYGKEELSNSQPCSMGSNCFVTATGDVYFLNGDDNEWKVMS